MVYLVFEELDGLDRDLSDLQELDDLDNDLSVQRRELFCFCYCSIAFAVFGGPKKKTKKNETKHVGQKKAA